MFSPPFLFNFVMDDILWQTLENSAAYFSDTEDETLFDPEYVDDILCTFEMFTVAHSLLESLIFSAARYGHKFALTKC